MDQTAKEQTELCLYPRGLMAEGGFLAKMHRVELSAWPVPL